MMSTNSGHVNIQLGIWTIVVNKAASSSFVPEWLYSLPHSFHQLWTFARYMYPFSDSARSVGRTDDEKSRTKGIHSFTGFRTLTQLCVFVKELYSLGPLYFVTEVLLYLWVMLSGALELYCTSHLLSLISHTLQSGRLHPWPIVQALTYKLVLSVLSAYIRKKGEKCSIILRDRVKYHFLEKAMRSALNFDAMTLEDPEVRRKLDVYGSDLIPQRSEAWEAFSEIMETLTRFTSIVSELSVMLRLSRNGSGFAVAVLAGIASPLLTRDSNKLFDLSYAAFCSNPHFIRMASLHRLAFSSDFREDRISNNLGQYIEREFKSSRSSLGDVNTEDAYSQWDKNQPAYVEVLENLTWSPFLVIFALQVLWDHSGITLDDLILIQQTSQSVQSTMYSLLYNLKGISDSFNTIKNIYALEDIENVIEDGDTPYPAHSEKESYTGAEIEFRNVSFTYHGTGTDALSNVSFTIKPGQLVVIVGTNGSGKTSTVKLLSRLYDPKGGEILLDGRPLKSYRLEDIRRATAVLCQDHPVLPLSLRENVALGLPERNATGDEIDRAIHEGGAARFVHKLRQGLDTVLHPVCTVTTNFIKKRDDELEAVVDGMEAWTSLSGGETQRLSASRTFMKLTGGNVRLLIADEPTSALDAEGEYELFKRLRKHSGGKTVIFITHRFGHLTKHADLILCLRDGELVEQGTHEALMKLDGEYKMLYELQAGAFEAE